MNEQILTLPSPAGEITTPPVDPVNTLLTTEFNDPALWKENNRPILPAVYSYSNVRHPRVYGDLDTARYVADGPPRPWLAAAYGARLVADPTHTEDNGILTET